MVGRSELARLGQMGLIVLGMLALLTRSLPWQENGTRVRNTIALSGEGTPPVSWLTLYDDSVIYIVQSGDNLSKIARGFGSTVQAISEANQILNPNIIHIGQNLLIPVRSHPPVAAPSAAPTVVPDVSPPPGLPAEVPPEPMVENSFVIHIFSPGETLYQIAGHYGSTVGAILAANDVTNPIPSGHALKVPVLSGAQPPPVTAVLAPPSVEAGGAPPPPSEPGAAANGELLWPNDYRGLFKRYHYGHTAIDIAMPPGSEVAAAAAGVVEFSGWHAAGFGYLLIIDHGDGRRSIYAHNSELMVAAGQSVAQGQTVALSGSTGYSTHPHLHFGITENLRMVDPCTRLAGSC